ncbi:hypothetical protein EON65_27210 [archaeon]|nr:MAG: hypothetical protein EON65_27210 [archaeon]
MSEDYKFQDEWTPDVEKAVKGWLSDTYRKWENEEPDQEFLEYITVRNFTLKEPLGLAILILLVSCANN